MSQSLGFKHARTHAAKPTEDGEDKGLIDEATSRLLLKQPNFVHARKCYACYILMRAHMQDLSFLGKKLVHNPIFLQN